MKLKKFKLILRGNEGLFIIAIVTFLLCSVLQSLSATMLYPLTESISNPSAFKLGFIEKVNSFLFGMNDFSIVLIETCTLSALSFIMLYLNVVIARSLSL